MIVQSVSAQTNPGTGEPAAEIPGGAPGALAKPAVSALDHVADPETKGASRPTAAAEVQLKTAEEIHQYVREYIRNADQKAAFFFAAATAGLAFLHSQGTANRWLKSPITWTLIDLLAFVATAGLGIGAAVLLAAVFPRLGGSKRGLLFFNAIAEYETSSDYAKDVALAPPAEILRAKLQHVHDLARVCRAQYKTLVIGFSVSSVGAVAALLYFTVARFG